MRRALAGPLEHRGRGVGRNHIRPQLRQAAREQAVATGDLEHPLALDITQQPLHGRTHQAEVEVVAGRAHLLVPEPGVVIPAGADVVIQLPLRIVSLHAPRLPLRRAGCVVVGNRPAARS